MSLSERLRLAALERARQSGQKIDNYVLEPSGVIDLREMERQPSPAVDNSVALPEIGESATVGDLYGRPLAETRLWSRVRGTMVPIADAAEPSAERVEAPDAVEHHDETITLDLTEEVPSIEIDEPAPAGGEPMLEEQPTAPCQRCGATAKRDLIDIFNSLEYYSCDDCGHMWQQKKD